MDIRKAVVFGRNVAVVVSMVVVVATKVTVVVTKFVVLVKKAAMVAGKATVLVRTVVVVWMDGPCVRDGRCRSRAARCRGYDQGVRDYEECCCGYGDARRGYEAGRADYEERCRRCDYITLEFTTSLGAHSRFWVSVGFKGAVVSGGVSAHGGVPFCVEENRCMWKGACTHAAWLPLVTMDFVVVNICLVE